MAKLTKALEIGDWLIKQAADAISGGAKRVDPAELERQAQASQQLRKTNFTQLNPVEGRAKPEKKPVKKKEGAVGNLNLREMPIEEAREAARSGKHLVPKPGGGFQGGPRNVQNTKDLAANRKRMDRDLAEAAREIEQVLGPERVGDWYPSQRRGVELVTEPHQRRRMAEAEGVFSPQTDPRGELGFSVTAHNRYNTGRPVGVVRTGEQGRKYEEAMVSGQPMRQGPKTEVYAQQSDPTRPLSPFGTNDFREAGYQGFTEPTGVPQTRGLSPAQHVWMDAEKLLQIERANQANLGGRTDWSGSMAQEVPWVVQKADALQKTQRNKFPDTPEGRRAALEEGSATVETHIPEYTMTLTPERIPGEGTGHRPDLLTASPDLKAEYGGSGWNYEDDGRDKILSALGFLQKPGRTGAGMWKDQDNPLYMKFPLMNLVNDPKLGRTVDPETLSAVRMGEIFRGGIDAQNAVAAHMPFAQSSRNASAKADALLRSPTPEVPFTGEQLRDIQGYLPDDWSVTASDQGAMLLNLTDPAKYPLRQAASDIEAMKEPLSHLGNLERVGREGFYEPVHTRGEMIGDKYVEVPEERGQGKVATKILEAMAKAPPESSKRLSESEAVRQEIAARMYRDQAAKEAGNEVRDDLQYMRKFFSQADYDKAVELIRKGMSPTAAVGLLGYSLGSMAGEELPPSVALPSGR